MHADAEGHDIEAVANRLRSLGFSIDVSRGQSKTVIGVLEDPSEIRDLPWQAMSGVESVINISSPYKLASRAFRPEKSIVRVGEAEFGGSRAVIIGGPCAVESEPQLFVTARAVKAAGGDLLRGGAFKPRTAPRSFQGLELEGLKLLKKSKEEIGLCIVSEVMAPEDVQTVGEYIDMFQIGARNMQNFPLLKAVGKTQMPVLLKRGFSNTIEEWLLAAEYILMGGNSQVVLCERGIRTFEPLTRNTLDLSSVCVVKELSHLPVIVDPSHATGKRSLVVPMARAAVAAGADGVIVDVHPNPAAALVDGPQALTLDEFHHMAWELRLLDDWCRRSLHAI